MMKLVKEPISKLNIAKSFLDSKTFSWQDYMFAVEEGVRSIQKKYSKWLPDCIDFYHDNQINEDGSHTRSIFASCRHCVELND